MSKKPFNKAVARLKEIRNPAGRTKSVRTNERPDPDVREIRRAQGLTLHEFSARYCLSVELIRGWEQARRKPNSAARALLQIIKKEPQAVARALRPRLGRV
jgi:putative transcriptional regulator